MDRLQHVNEGRVVVPQFGARQCEARIRNLPLVGAVPQLFQDLNKAVEGRDVSGVAARLKAARRADRNSAAQSRLSIASHPGASSPWRETQGLTDEHLDNRAGGVDLRQID